MSVALATEILRTPGVLADNLARVEVERERLSAGLRAIGWPAEPSVTNFILVPFADAEAAAEAAEALLRRGLVPRTFPAGHPLAHSLRLTVRDAAEDDLLLAAARATVSSGESAP